MKRYNHFDQNDTPEPHALSLKTDEVDDKSVTRLNDVSFHWTVSKWSECSQSCGANGSGYKVIAHLV